MWADDTIDDYVPTPKGKNHLFIKDDVDEDGFIRLIDRWYFDITKDLRRKPTLLMGCQVWGEKFIYRFLNLCLPSLMAEGNIPKIKSGIYLMIYTDEAGKDILEKGTAFLSEYRVTVDIRIIPQHIMDAVSGHEFNKYWMLGAVQMYFLRFAKKNGMGFHMLMPDHIYARNYLTNIARLSQRYDAIVQSSISGDVDSVEEKLKPHFKDGVLSVGGKELVSYALEHLHKQMVPMVTNDTDLMEEAPLSHCFIWIGKDFIVTSTPHTSLAFMSAKAIHDVPFIPYSPLDTQAPHLMPKELEVYVPGIEDDVSFIEVSDDSKHCGTYPVKFPELCFRFWETAYFNEGYLRFMELINIFPVNEDVCTKALAGKKPATIEFVREIMSRVVKAILHSKDFMAKVKKDYEENQKKEETRAA